MSFYYPPWDQGLEPSQGSCRQWLDNLYSKFQPIEQSRWCQSNIDTLFYAGSQTYVNRHFNQQQDNNNTNFFLNILQQPVNMITGYQRQHRKQPIFEAADLADPQTTDQYTRIIQNCFHRNNINDAYSRSCELAAVAGMNLLQPYLDFTGDDPAQGELKVKVWEYNSFLVDPFFREPDMSDANFVWCQEYISKKEADARFPDKKSYIIPMAGTPQRYGSFYFLPENYNMARNDLLVLSYVWYKWKRKKKRLYSESRKQFFDFAEQDNELIEQVLYQVPDLEEVVVEVPTWKLAVVLNDVLMFQGDNPLGFDECPFIVNYWNYEPHQNYYDLRSRSLTYSMRTPQFLFTHKVLANNDIASATINAGWKRKIGAVANEDNLKKAGQGWDIIINEGFELEDCEKIIPSAVPESDLALAQQMNDLIFAVSGINLENWSGQTDKQISSLTLLMKQAANLMVFQKYFDQWDLVLKLLAERCLSIVQNKWNAEKVKLLIGEEPSPFFYSKIFAKYKTVVEEGLMTATQKNLQAQQMLDINSTFGREVIPASMIIKDMNIQGKKEIMEFLQSQEQQQSAAAQDMQTIQHAFEEAKLQELKSKAVNNLAAAKERYGRFESNIGLLEERMAEVSKNRALSTKAKMEALEKLVDVIAKFGEVETILKMNDIQSLDYQAEGLEDQAKDQAYREANANEFMSKIMNNPMAQVNS